MGDGHHLYPRTGRLPLPLCHNRPLQPLRCGMVAPQHVDVGVVQDDRGDRRRGTWRTRDPEHRPGGPVHFDRVCRVLDKGKGDQAEYGRKGKGLGQHIRRTPQAQRQVRTRIPFPGRRRDAMLQGAGRVFHVLQQRTAAPKSGRRGPVNSL